MAPDEAFEAALEIYSLLPGESDELAASRARETAGARAAWLTLRSRLTRRVVNEFATALDEPARVDELERIILRVGLA